MTPPRALRLRHSCYPLLSTVTESRFPLDANSPYICCGAQEPGHEAGPPQTPIEVQMSKSRFGGGTIRKLWHTETQKFRDHLTRLDEESRRMRFGMSADDDFIAAYAERTDFSKGVIYGYFVGGEMRAAAELRSIGASWSEEAEAAFSVETPWQDTGVGTDLLGRIILAARNRGIDRLYMNCLSENRKMQRIARKYDAELHFDHGEVVGQVKTTGPTPASLWSEAMDDSNGFVMAVLEFPLRMLPAA
jgi:RimJ/RimL family protein N-acetyltransferase